MTQAREYDVVVVGSGGGAMTGAFLAQKAGLSTAVVEKTADFPAAFAQAQASGKPSIIHLKIDPEAISTFASISAIREKALAAADGKPGTHRS